MQVKADIPLEHLSWVGQYIVDEFYDKDDVTIINLGDFADFPSLSMYDRGKKAMEGRRYLVDVDAANEGWALLNAPLVAHNKNLAKTKHAQWRPRRIILLGNHEDRVTRATEDNAQLSELLNLDHLDYARSGWEVIPFLEVLWVDGVAYSHYFYNPMTGKALGGASIDTRLKTIGMSFTMGHQQTLMYGLRFVGGKSQHGLVAGACYLHNEEYKGPQGNAHWRGLIVKYEVNDGSYCPLFVSLDFLCRRYEGVTLDKFMAKKYPNL